MMKDPLTQCFSTLGAHSDAQAICRTQETRITSSRTHTLAAVELSGWFQFAATGDKWVLELFLSCVPLYYFSHVYLETKG